jgi:hypothetical protein
VPNNVRPYEPLTSENAALVLVDQTGRDSDIGFCPFMNHFGSRVAFCPKALEASPSTSLLP